ncbi:MAG: alpha/beta hydrolase [Jatrophihabitantaceae bacterium]
MTHLPRRVVVAVCGPLYRISLDDRRTVTTQRRLSEASVRLNRVPRGTRVEHVTLSDRPAERVTSDAAEGGTAILYLHGGGYVIGSPRMYRAMAAHLARAAGAPVYTLDYRLAPEHRYPAALEDATAAFRGLVDLPDVAANRIAIAGDSAGGGLAVAAARVLTDAGLRPAALGLLSPWTDPADEDMPERDFVVNLAWGRANAARYRGGASPTDPGYAPLHGRLDGLPPMLIHCGAQEMLNGQIKRFGALAAEAGVDVRLVEYPLLWHSGHILAGMLREASDATRDLGVFLRAHLEHVSA